MINFSSWTISRMVFNGVNSIIVFNCSLSMVICHLRFSLSSRLSVTKFLKPSLYSPFVCNFRTSLIFRFVSTILEPSLNSYKKMFGIASFAFLTIMIVIQHKVIPRIKLWAQWTQWNLHLKMYNVNVTLLYSKAPKFKT